MAEIFAGLAGLLCAVSAAAAGVLALRMSGLRYDNDKLKDALERTNKELARQVATAKKLYAIKDEEIEDLTARLVDCSDPDAIRDWFGELLEAPDGEDSGDD